MQLSKQRRVDAQMRTKEKYLRYAFIFAIAFVLLGGTVLAYSSGARNSLLRSRDQVAEQRSQLERAYNDVDSKIDQLQQQKSTLYRYLQDCDRSIKDLDRALSAQDSAYRDVR